MRKKFTFLLMALLALAGFKSWGQESQTITIGTGTATLDDMPFNSFFNYSYAQMLYLGSEIGESGTITSISFYAQGSVNAYLKLDIYMKCVDRDSYSNTSDWESVSAENLVYHNESYLATSTGWITFNLVEPFQYDKSKNLMIAFDNNTGSYFNSKQFRYTNTSGNTCIYRSDDNNNVDPMSPAEGNPAVWRPNIQITIEPAVSCPAPTGLTASDITATGATISWTGNGAESYDLAYGVASTFDLSNPATYTLEDGLTATSVQLTGLTAETEYKCAVKAHCSDEEESAWSSVITFMPSAFSHLTVNDGTDTYDKVPFYGDNAYYNTTKSQFVIPASYMEDMQGCEITQLKFYVNSSSSYNSNYTSHTWDVYVKEMDDPSRDWWDFYDFGTMTNVYSGSVSIVNNELTITLDEPFQYNNKSLMIGFNQTNTGFYGETHWLGSNNTTGSAGTNRSRAGWQNGNQKETKPFLPKTTFTYIPGGERYTVTVNQSEHGVITADPKTDVTAGTTVTLSATPANGYDFDEWTVINSTTLEEITVTDNQFVMPESDVTVSATFDALEPHMVIIGEIQNGTVALFPDDPEEYLAGETVYLNVVPNEGYFYPSKDEIHVTDVNLNDIEVIIDGTDYSFIMPDSEVTVTAVFNLYYGVQVDPEIVGGQISAISEYEYLVEGMPYFTAGSDVFFIPNPEEDYEYVDRSVSVNEYDFEEIGNPVDVDYNSGLARITMPESDIYVTASFNRIKYSVTQQITNPAEGGYFYIANTEHIAVGASVTISSISPSEGYQLASVTVTRNDTGATVETHENWGNYTFYMPASDVTVTVNFEARPRYSVSVGDVVNGTITVDEPYENILAGTTVYLTATPATGYTLESLTVTPEEGDPFEPTQEYSYYSFTMPSSNVTISATFRPLQSYTINYYVNGELDRTMQCQEDRFVNNEGPQNVAVPAGVTFEGWGVAEIGTYTTEKPAILGNAEKPTQNYGLYAVLSYSEQIPATSKDGETWVEVTSPSDLSNGDQVIIVKKSSNVVMCDRSGEYSGSFEKATISISGNEITSLPSNAVILTAIDNSGNWKFSFTDAYFGASTLADYSGGYLVPLNVWGGCDTWTIEQNGSSVDLIDTQYNKYLSLYSGYFTVDGTGYYKAELFKKYNPFITNTYYMTSVLTDGTVAENTTAKNIIITTGTVTVDNNIVLTMAENGLFRNEDADNFVFEDGAQLIYDGDETVNATMKKNIAGTNWYTISSPLANSVEFAEVENLIPSSGVTGTDYDLYRFDEANSIWVNSRVWQNNEPNTTIIANPDFTTIDKGLGYIYANETATELAFAGEINVADVENVNLTMTADKGKGFNLIGNPFAQNIKMTDVKAGTAVLAGGFYVLTNQDTWATEPITTGTIAPLQGFLVQATTAGTATISKPTAAPSKGERSEQNTNIEMIVSNSIYRDNAFAMFGEGIGLNKVNHRNTEAPMLYVPQDGEKFAIAFMDENTTVFPLNFKAMTTGKYSISLKATDDINTLVLIDNMTGVETNMLLENSYSFNGSPADSDGRFTVKLSISHSNGQSDNEHFVYQNGKELVVNGEGSLQIFDVLGRVVISEEVHGQTVYVGNLSEGAYIVRMTGNEIKTQKIIIR